MVRILLISLVIFLILFIVLATLIIKYYKKCPPGFALVIFNSRADAWGNTIKVIKSGGAFIWPVGGSHILIDLSPFSLPVTIEKIYDNEAKAYSLKTKFMLAKSADENVLQRSFERYSGLSNDRLGEIVSDLSKGHIRTYFASLKQTEHSNMEELTKNLSKLLIEPIEDTGLNLLNIEILEIKKN
jgi:flotillin